MAKVKKESNTVEVLLKDNYMHLQSIIVGYHVINFTEGKATVTNETAEQIKEYIQ